MEQHRTQHGIWVEMAFWNQQRTSSYLSSVCSLSVSLSDPVSLTRGILVDSGCPGAWLPHIALVSAQASILFLALLDQQPPPQDPWEGGATWLDQCPEVCIWGPEVGFSY